MPGRRGDVGIGEALVEIGLAVAVEIDEPGDLIAAQDVDRIGPRSPGPGRGATPTRSAASARSCSVSSRPSTRQTSPCIVQSDGRTVGEEVVAAEVQEGLPRILDRRRDRIDGVGPAGAERAGRGDDLRPLRLAAAGEVGERVPVGRGDLAHELAVLDPRGVEHLHVADAVGEDRPLAVAVEAAVDERLRHRLPLPASAACWPAGRMPSMKPKRWSLKRTKPPFPERFDLQRVRVEAGGHLAVVAESHAHAARHRQLAGAKHAALERAEIGLIPAVVAPDVVVLVAPVAVLAAVEAGPFGQQQRQRSLRAEVQRLARVEVVDAIAVDVMRSVRPILRPQRFAAVGELRRLVRKIAPAPWSCRARGDSGRGRGAAPRSSPRSGRPASGSRFRGAPRSPSWRCGAALPAASCRTISLAVSSFTIP